MEESECPRGQTTTEFEENHFATEAEKNALLGRIITQKTLNKKTIKRMIKKGWGGDPEGLSIIDLAPNTFIFNFTR